MLSSRNVLFIIIMSTCNMSAMEQKLHIPTNTNQHTQNKAFTISTFVSRIISHIKNYYEQLDNGNPTDAQYLTHVTINY